MTQENKDTSSSPDKGLPKRPRGGHPRISWHPAFVQAMQMELAQYGDALEFTPEYQLAKEPLRIDLVIIKKVRDVVIDKNIAAIFRGHNLLEFKGPGGYVSIDTFYKVYGYACLYASMRHFPITDLTLTFVESRLPRDLLAHFREIRGYRVEKTSPGIYTVVGDIIPIQIIDQRRLSEEENLWLKGLGDKLDLPVISRVAEAIEGLDETARVGAYWDALIRANPEKMKEVLQMARSTLTIEQVLEDVGLTAKWEARAEARATEREREQFHQKLLEGARKQKALGASRDLISAGFGLSPQEIDAL
jgi:hypothetical protein